MPPDVAFGSIVRCRGLAADRALKRRSWIIRDSGGGPGAACVGADVANPFPLLGQSLQRVPAGSPIRDPRTKEMSQLFGIRLCWQPSCFLRGRYHTSHDVGSAARAREGEI